MRCCANSNTTTCWVRRAHFETGALARLSAAQLMKLLMAYRLRVEQGKKVRTWVRLKWALTFGFRLFSFLKGEATEVIASLEKAFYRVL